MGTTELALPKIVEILQPGGLYEQGKVALRKEHGVVLENAKKLTAITTAEEAESVTNFGRLLQAAKSEAEAFYKPFKKQVDDLKAPILADEHDDVDPYEAEKKRLGTLLTGWNKKVREEQEAAERKAREEAAKKAQEEALLRAIEVEEVNGTEAALEVLEEPVYVPPVVTQSQVVKPKGSVSSLTYKATVTNLMELVQAVAAGKAPLQALLPNESFLNNQARQFKEAFSIPGTKLETQASTGFRR
jgi:hypothetical protein